jgi:hypothetical protein
VLCSQEDEAIDFGCPVTKLPMPNCLNMAEDENIGIGITRVPKINRQRT